MVIAREPVPETTAEATEEAPVVKSPSHEAGAMIRCPAPDCGEANPRDRTHCRYCNTPLSVPCSSPIEAAQGCPTASGEIRQVVLQFPWGPVEIRGELPIGRDAAFSCLAQPLQPYDNVSRRHAYVRVKPTVVVVYDVGTMNGTYVNDIEIPRNQEVPLRDGDRLRFAKDITATLRIAYAGCATAT
jgi:hypothetical protein